MSGSSDVGVVIHWPAKAKKTVPYFLHNPFFTFLQETKLLPFPPTNIILYLYSKPSFHSYFSYMDRENMYLKKFKRSFMALKMDHSVNFIMEKFLDGLSCHIM